MVSNSKPLTGYKRKPSKSGYGNPFVRFWKYIDRNGPIHPIHGQCWVWTAAKFSDGYGTFHAENKQYRAHRYAWKVYRGRIPAGLQVLHKCDNRACVRISHLFLGTHQDNMDDMKAKGRVVIVPKKMTEDGKRRLIAALKARKLTEEHKQKIRDKLKGRTFSQETLEKIRQNKLEYWSKQENRQKTSTSLKKAWAEGRHPGKVGH